MTTTLTQLRPVKLGVRAEMKELPLRQLVFQRGVDATWELAMLCPCERQLTMPVPGGVDVTGRTREKRSNCPACQGTGIIYHSAQPITVLITEPAKDPQRFTQQGMLMPGRVQATFLPETLPGYLDRIRLGTNVISFTDIRLREGTVDVLRYPVIKRTVTVGTPGNPTVPLVKVVSVLNLRKADAQGVIVAGELVEGTDFDVNGAGNIDWTKGIANGKAPAVGSRYALAYYTHPVYVVRSMPHVYRDTISEYKSKDDAYFVALPTTVDAQLEWLGEAA